MKLGLCIQWGITVALIMEKLEAHKVASQEGIHPCKVFSFLFRGENVKYDKVAKHQGNHGIREWFGLKKTLLSFSSSPLAIGENASH